jgi:hypothetical protein
MLADRLHKSLEEVMQLTTLELDLWAAYIHEEYELKRKERLKHGNKRRL